MLVLCRSFLFSMAVLFALAACGGGGGNNSSNGDNADSQFTVTVTAGAGGSVSPASVAVDADDTTVITASPDNLYVLDNILGTCTGLLNGNEYTVGPVTGDCTAEFVFVYAGPPLTPATLNLGGGQQQFLFTWTDVADADFYRLMENPDGISGFSQIGTDISPGTQSYQHPVTLYRRINASYMLQSCNSAGCTDSATIFASDDLISPIVYVKSSNTSDGDFFGTSVAVSSDGTTLAVGATGETVGLATDAGAVYVFVRNGGVWSQQDRLIASDASGGAFFGASVSLSDDGNTLAVGATNGFIGGSAYVFTRSAGVWTELAPLAHPNLNPGDRFGVSVSLSGDGQRLAISAPNDDSDTSGINQANNNNGIDTGAVYTYLRIPGPPPSWVATDYIKAGSSGDGDLFGISVSMDADGSTLAVGSPGEDSANFDEANNGLENSGAVYVFQRSGANWSQQVFLKASNRAINSRFGQVLDLDAVGDTLAIGAFQESSVASVSGAAYIFQQSAPVPTGFWGEYSSIIKADNAGAFDSFGLDIQLSADGNTLAVGASGEDGGGFGVDADATDNSGSNSGAVYLFEFENSAWSSLAYVKARHKNDGAPQGVNTFGSALALSSDGSTLAVGASNEYSTTTGIDSTPVLTGDSNGAVFVY